MDFLKEINIGTNDHNHLRITRVKLKDDEANKFRQDVLALIKKSIKHLSERLACLSSDSAKLPSFV